MPEVKIEVPEQSDTDVEVLISQVQTNGKTVPYVITSGSTVTAVVKDVQDGTTLATYSCDFANTGVVTVHVTKTPVIAPGVYRYTIRAALDPKVTTLVWGAWEVEET